MKLEMRLAGLFASATFIIIAVGGYFSTSNPLHALLYGMGASVSMGLVGHRIGYILSHPAGKKRNKRGHGAKPGKNTPAKNAPLTGNEIFLEDINV